MEIAQKKKKGEIPWESWETNEGLDNWIKELEGKKVRYNIMIRELGNLSYEVQGSQEQNQANRLSHCAQCNKKTVSMTDIKNGFFSFKDELKGFNKLKGEIDEKERVICHNIFLIAIVKLAMNYDILKKK